MVISAVVSAVALQGLTWDIQALSHVFQETALCGSHVRDHAIRSFSRHWVSLIWVQTVTCPLLSPLWLAPTFSSRMWTHSLHFSMDSLNHYGAFHRRVWNECACVDVIMIISYMLKPLDKLSAIWLQMTRLPYHSLLLWHIPCCVTSNFNISALNRRLITVVSHWVLYAVC